VKKIQVSACYCEIPREKLFELVRRRFIDGTATQELMKEMPTEKDREYLATVALLDVKEEDLVEMVEAKDPSRLRHILGCRAGTKQILKNHGLYVKER